ncbi:Serine/threonine-protein kinase svkA [Cyberlindnera fabianii]|uniref:non-specific serine/threonine protein kinase n=1 Tax=Cyberlindnera fabianii TaxID=36022 RepID=A0A1V2L8C7_CYBFA|nr:Serine/threonine-protein kinase svkA [Cyberlindnera fabianii]
MRYLSANQFDVFEQIGKGGFGVVYRGIDKVTKQPVAIKQIDLEKTDSIEDLQREIKILSLCRLDQITRYHGCFLKGHKLWIIMEYLDAGSCMDLLAPGPIKEKHIAILLRELLHALCYLHENSRIHRDIKAANILLNKNGDVKIADFGVSTQLSNNLSRRNTFVGSPYWMSPEVIMEEEYNFKADIWSLGITAIELATGKPPLSHIPPMKVLFKIPENSPPRLEGEKFSEEFKDFVAHCLQMNPNSRPSAKRLLKHRFITWAGRKSSLIELIQRREKWELNHADDIKKHQRLYVPTVMEDRGQHEDSSITFDFDDSSDKIGNASEVIITKKSPLKYSGRDTSVLSQNNSILNMASPPSNSFKHRVSSSSSSSSSPTRLPVSKRRVSVKPNITKEAITSAFQDTIRSIPCNDDVQMVKLEHINLLLQELDESTITSVHHKFTTLLEKHTTTTPASPPESKSEKEGKELKQQQKVYSSTAIVKKGSVEDKQVHGPRKAESEKLLLKRWADQYFI